MKGPVLASLGIEAGIIATSVACGNAAGAAGVGVPPNPIGGTPTEMFVAPDSGISKEASLQKPFVFESISQQQIENNPGLSALVQKMAQFGGENKLISDGQPVALAAMDIKGNQMLLMSVNNISDGKTIYPGFIIMEQGASAPVAAISGATTSDGLHTGIARLSDVEVSDFKTNGKLSQSYDSLTEDELALSFDINPDSEAGIKVIGDPSATSDMIDKALATTLKGVTFRSTHGFEVGLTAEEFIAGLTPDSTPTTNTASTGASEGRNFALAMLQSLSARLNPQVVTNVAASTIVAEPSATPTEQPTSQPPTATSTVAPTEEPTIQPTPKPPEPTVEVTQVAQAVPTATETPKPTSNPIEVPVSNGDVIKEYSKDGVNVQMITESNLSEHATIGMDEGQEGRIVDAVKLRLDQLGGNTIVGQVNLSSGVDISFTGAGDIVWKSEKNHVGYRWIATDPPIWMSHNLDQSGKLTIRVSVSPSLMSPDPARANNREVLVLNTLVDALLSLSPDPELQEAIKNKDTIAIQTWSDKHMDQKGSLQEIFMTPGVPTGPFAFDIKVR